MGEDADEAELLGYLAADLLVARLMHGDAAALQAVSVAAEHATLRTLQALFPQR